MNKTPPLAARMRPKLISEFVGQEHLLRDGALLAGMLAQGRLESIILSGPPGVGKTTLARLLSHTGGYFFVQMSAIAAGVKDIRQTLDDAQARDQPTLVFVDEVHRFNKSQQDAFLSGVEDGVITFLGATTENPGFYVNNALLSRVQVLLLQPLQHWHLQKLLQRALDTDVLLKHLQLTFAQEAIDRLCDIANGDARRLLNNLEALVAGLPVGLHITEHLVREKISYFISFDHKGDEFYQCISALHKSVRGSDPDASLYWLVRMLEGGCDSAYIFRRLIRMASEDIGNADPRALQVCMDAVEAFDRLGLPEGELAIAQAVLYLAVAPKSNSVYLAYKAAKKSVQTQPAYPVPAHLCNAPTKHDKVKGMGVGYQYPHDYDDAFVPGADYFPPQLKGTQYYFPVERGMEQKIAVKLRHLRSLKKS